MSIFRLTKELIFPNPKLGEEDGLLAVGGDLSMERLLLAYSNGIFPWYGEDEPILWWCPQERFIIFPKEIKISKSMKKILKKDNFKVTFNEDFIGVISSCKELREKSGTWITDEMKDAYINLYKEGFATSVEVWEDGELVGGLYGVNIGKSFFGESMFSKCKNASKIALIELAKKLEKEEYKFIDCQFHTEHLESMGGRSIDYDTYMEMLNNGMGRG